MNGAKVSRSMQALMIGSAVAILLTLLLSVLVSVELWWPYQGLTQYRFTVDTHDAVAGGLLRFHVAYCVDTHIPIPAHVDRELELQDPSVFSFAITELGYIIRRRCEVKERVINIPSGAPPGRYHLHLTTELVVNSLRTIRQTWQSEDFAISERKDDR